MMVNSYGFSVGDKVILVKNTPIAVEGHIDFIENIRQTNDKYYEIELKGIPGRFVYDHEIELLAHTKKEQQPLSIGDICTISDELAQLVGQKEVCVHDVFINKGRFEFSKWPLEEDWEYNVQIASVRDIEMVLWNHFEEEKKAPCDGQTSTEQAIHSPKHYSVFDGIEAIEIIASSLTQAEFRGYCFGNLLKYRLRVGKKDNIEQELGKADKYQELFDEFKHLCRGEKCD